MPAARVGPGHERQHQQAGHRRYPLGQPPGPVAHVAGGLQAQERRAVQQADRHERDSGEHAVRLQQRPERPGVLVAGVDRQPVQQVAEGHAEQQRGQQAAHRQRRIPGAPPARRAPLAAVLERHAAHDQRGQQQDEREVEPGEPGRIPAGERGEDRGSGHDQPDLVAVPQRADRVDRGPPARLVGTDRVVQHADPEVEALQDEEPGPQDRDDDEPERDHRDLNTGRPERARPRRSGRARAEAARGSTSASAGSRPRRARRTAAQRPPG